MKVLLTVVAVIAVWFVMNRWVLPSMGVGT